MNVLIEQIKQGLSDANFSLNSMSDGSAVILDTRRERLLTLNASASVIIAAIQQGIVELKDTIVTMLKD